VDFMAVTARQTPDFRTISDFRKRHLKALGALFGQVLALCEAVGLVKLGHVALDGTKVHANASKHKAMSYGRMREREPELAAEVARWFAEAEARDQAEDDELGPERRGDELPEWVANKRQRLAKIREAKAALEAEAEQGAEEGSEQGSAEEPTEGGAAPTKRGSGRRQAQPPSRATTIR
jgi:hypothetical protein